MPEFLKPGQTLGAVYLGGQATHFRVWAPTLQRLELRLLTPSERSIPLDRTRDGYWQATVTGVEPGDLYVYRIDGEKERPDPASRHQPDGVHGPSQVVATDGFAWTDAGWQGLPLERFVIYELHVGTFTPEGTFDAMIPYLPGLKYLGVTALELMPVAQFPGTRNWGYDGVGPFAAQNSYGGPHGFQRLVDAAHKQGLAVILDVVYNHMGFEGNYLGDYGPYFTDRYKTSWGSAVNLDGPYSDDVRRYLIENAIYWLSAFHIDALRLDAVHALLDFSAGTFLEDLASAVGRQRDCQQRQMYLFAESDLNDNRVLRPLAEAGLGLDAQSSDDFHHAVHTLLTHERDGYYQDFVSPGGAATVHYLAKALREGWVYSGQYSRFRRRRHGNSPVSVPAAHFIVCLQNYDQIGNRMMGDRLSTQVSVARLKLGAAVLLLSPFVPLLFMGEEYGETNPFQYFVSHSDPLMVEAVRQGRRAEFSAFVWAGEPPDPASEETFLRSKLCRQDAHADGHRVIYDLYRELLRLRQDLPALRELSKERLEVIEFAHPQLLYLRRWASIDAASQQVFAAFNFGDEPVDVRLPVPSGRWRKLLDSADPSWQSDNEYELLSEPLAPQPAFVAAGVHADAPAKKSRRTERHTPTPERLHANGPVEFTLHATAFVLYAKESES